MPITHQRFGLLFYATTVIIVLMTITACAPRDWLERFRDGQMPPEAPLELSVFWEVWQIIDSDFGGRESVDEGRLAYGAIQGMIDAFGDESILLIDHTDYDIDTDGFGTVWQAWDTISKKLDDFSEAITTQQLQESAIRGMLSALGNRNTIYLSRIDYELELQNLKSNFEGIGVFVDLLDGQLTVVAPIPGTPAEHAGIKSGDVILAADGKSLDGLQISESTLIIRGPKGTPIDLLVLSVNEEKPRIVTVVRDTIRTPTVAWEPITSDIAYLRISQFLDETDDETSQALGEIAIQGFDGLILDVRRNPGGLMSDTVNVTSQFLQDGLVLRQDDGRGNRIDFNVKQGGVAKDIPLVVLMDRGSASASEILVGALQDHHRCIAIGTKTYGKGSVNELRRLQDGSGIYLTSALWYTPSGRIIEGEGLDPDIFVAMDLHIPIGSQLDMQLKSAIEYLRDETVVPNS
ncbi:S41 family peptidase [Dehalococcoidia bacterium]|nr:S41 family peptidase [Dehalococcoidia bacterium]MCL0044006.1 S41 family peptidase [Dehalococcoidia bacterium]